jgi:predicted ester cyclase
MKKTVVLIIVFILLCHSVFAAGKIEEEEKPEINNNWILCITALDSSALPESRQVVADLFMRGLRDKIQAVNYRLRVSHEYAYYEDYAWSRDLTAAAKALESKYNERSLLLYQGTSAWKYRRDLKKKDDEIVALRDALEKVQAERPLVNRTPEFDITADNKSGNFPAVPVNGGEYRFCQSQSADAFLSGTVTEFYGRFFITLKLYVRYTRSWIYEDDVLFSADDIDEAVDDISSRLLTVLA